MKAHFDKRAELRDFSPGDMVLMLNPVAEHALSVKFTGPFPVIKKLTNTTYLIQTSDRRQKERVCHVNMLKRYHSPLSSAEPPSEEKVCAAFASEPIPGEDVPPQLDKSVGPRLENSQVLAQLHKKLDYLEPMEQKPDGTPRFITDYRKLNAVTIPDAYPLPRVDDCVDSVGNSRFVTKLDLLKGYWQVPLTEAASEASAFVTPDDFLEYTVMPFAKSDFVKATVTYLGKEVGQGSVRMLQDKIQAITEFPVPKTRRELRRFIGMVGYYRCLCKNFAVVASPLTDLLSSQVSFKWTTAAQGAFENCKLLLCSAPVLKAPDITRPFKLEIDASDVGMGAVLLQEDEGALDHPVSYFSKKFAKYQLHYSTVEKETLALVLAIQHFEVYLYPGSNPIVVYTDHNPLVFLSRMYNKNQRLMRWALLVQDYNLHIQHKKGTENIVADSLSRAF
uniref:ribonuclease H n=1 Tax=Nothobranchius kadleci TaxID=1051664 RepID=A0A1A8DUL4_NOTKA